MCNRVFHLMLDTFFLKKRDFVFVRKTCLLGENVSTIIFCQLSKGLIFKRKSYLINTIIFFSGPSVNILRNSFFFTTKLTATEQKIRKKHRNKFTTAYIGFVIISKRPMNLQMLSTVNKFLPIARIFVHAD